MNGPDGPELEALVASPVEHVGDPDPAIRRLAVSMLAGRAGDPEVSGRLLEVLAADPDGAVRAETAEILGSAPTAGVAAALLAAAEDTDVRVAEAAITALGEMGATPAIVARVTAAAVDGDADRLVREAAVAALGSLGDPGSIPVLLELLAGAPPQVRRRAVAALTVFDHPQIEPALRVAATDRNPMVREVAEMVVGHQRQADDRRAIPLTGPEPKGCPRTGGEQGQRAPGSGIPHRPASPGTPPNGRGKRPGWLGRSPVADQSAGEGVR